MKKLLLTSLLIILTISIYTPIDTLQTKTSMSFLSGAIASLLGVNPKKNAPVATPQAIKKTATANYGPYALANGGPPTFQTIPEAPYLNSDGSVYGSGSDGGSSTPAPVDTSALQGSVSSKIQGIINAYNQLQGNIDPILQQQTQQYNQQYGQQLDNLSNAYGTTTGQTQGNYAARGVGDSSFLANAQDANAKIYQQNVDSINQDKSAKLAALGQYGQGLKQQAQSGIAQYQQYLPQLGSYDPSSLASLDASLANVAPQIQQQAQGLGTNQQYQDFLQQHAPAANGGADALTQKLAQLTSSTAPLFAKNQIAQGLIKSSQLTDPNAQAYYDDYFQKLLNGQPAQGA